MTLSCPTRIEASVSEHVITISLRNTEFNRPKVGAHARGDKEWNTDNMLSWQNLEPPSSPPVEVESLSVWCERTVTLFNHVMV